MPGWVLPAVAAELWGVPVEQVLADVATGRVSSRIEGELVFVDVQPSVIDARSSAQDDDDEIAAPPAQYRRSLAWAIPPSGVIGPIAYEPVVTAAERDALLNEEATMAASDSYHDDDDSDDDDDDDDDFTPPPDADDPVDDPPDEPIHLTADDVPNWNQVRARVSRTRRPPNMRAAA